MSDKEYRLSPYRWIILIFAIICYAIVFLHRMSPTVMADAIMSDLGVSAAFMGLLAGAYFYPYAIMQIPSGILSDKSSPRLLMVFSMACSAIGTFIFAIATSASVIFIGRLLVGLGVSLVLMPVYKTLANWFTQKSYVIIVSSVLAIAGGVGAVLAGMPLSLSIQTFGWRTSSIAIAGFSALIALLALFLFKDSPESMGLPTVEKKEKNELLEKVSIPQAIKIVLARFNFWMIGIAFFVNGAILFSFTGLWAGVYYTNVVGLTRNEMSLLLSIAATLTIVTPIIFASIAAKTKSRKNIFLFANAFLFLVMLYFYMRNGSFVKSEVYVWGVLLSVAATAPAGLYMASTRQLFSSNMAGTANGLVYSLCMIGSALFQPLIGMLLDARGYTNNLTAEMFEPAALLYLVSAGISFGAMFFLKQKDNNLV